MKFLLTLALLPAIFCTTLSASLKHSSALEIPENLKKQFTDNQNLTLLFENLRQTNDAVKLDLILLTTAATQEPYDAEQIQEELSSFTNNCIGLMNIYNTTIDTLLQITAQPNNRSNLRFIIALTLSKQINNKKFQTLAQSLQTAHDSINAPPLSSIEDVD